MKYEFNAHQFVSRSFSDVTAILVNETETSYITVEPLTYLWLQKHSTETPLEFFPFQEFRKSNVSMKPYRFTKEIEEWVVDFPVYDFTQQDITYILVFFNAFQVYREDRLTLRLEKTIEMTRKYLPLYLLQPMVQYVVNNSSKDQERIRLLLSESINHYVHWSD